MAVGVVLGVILGVGLALPLGRRIDRNDPPGSPSALSWAALGLGIAAVMMLVSALFLPLQLGGPAGAVMNTAMGSVMLSLAGMIGAVWALVRRDRRWVAWTAVPVAAVPALFWGLFAFGYLLDPTM